MGKIEKPLLFLFAFFLIGSWTTASTEKSERISAASGHLQITNDELFRRISDTSNHIKDLSAQVDFNLNLHSFGLSFNITGDYYYKQPDKVKLTLHHVPEFISSHQGEALSTINLLANLPKSVKDYDGRILAETPLFGRQCYLVELVPKTQQNISKIFLWVNSNSYTISQVILEYNDGSNVMQKKTYIETEHSFLVSKMETTVEAPGVEAEIDASFKDYQVNKGVSDTVFDTTSKQALSAF